MSLLTSNWSMPFLWPIVTDGSWSWAKNVMFLHCFRLKHYTHGCCYGLHVIWSESTATIVHDTPKVIFPIKQGSWWTLCIEVVFLSCLDVLKIDFDILIPEMRNAIIFRQHLWEISSNLSGLDCSCHVPRECSISCSAIPGLLTRQPGIPGWRFSSWRPLLISPTYDQHPVFALVIAT